MTDIKYCMVTSFTQKSVLFDETPMRSGLYQWIDIFKWITENWQEVDFEDFDVIHFNWCVSDTGIFQDIVKRTQNTSTKLIVNMDHTVDTYFYANKFPLQMIRNWMCGADCYFGTDKLSKLFLEYITNQKVSLIPHPVNTELLHKIKGFERQDRVGVIYHWYPNGRNIEIPYLVLSDLNKKRILLAYLPGSDPHAMLTKNMYSLRQEDNTFASFIEKMNECKIIMDPYPLRSWGRGVVESAALGIPNICSNLVDSSETCYPATNCDPFNIKQIYDLTKKLLDDPEFYVEVADHAYIQSDYYSKENAKKRFLEMIEIEWQC